MIGIEQIKEKQTSMMRMREDLRKNPFSLFWPDREVTFLEAYLTLVRDRRYQEHHNSYDAEAKRRYYVAVDALERETAAADAEYNWGHTPGFVRGAEIWSASNPRALHVEQYGYFSENRLPHLFVKMNPDKTTAIVYGSNGMQNTIENWRKVSDAAYWSAIHGANNRYPCGGYYVIFHCLNNRYY